MDENYAVNDWGIATVPKKKGFKGSIIAFGQIRAIERKVVLFQDDCTEYLIDKKDFVFEKKQAPVK